MKSLIGAGIVAVSFAVFNTPAVAQECSQLAGFARTLCQAAVESVDPATADRGRRQEGIQRRQQEMDLRRHQEQERKKQEAAADPAVEIRQEELRIIDASMDCRGRVHAANPAARGNDFSQCDAKMRVDEAALDIKRQNLARRQREADAGESIIKFHYKGNYYVDPGVLQSLAEGIGNFADIVGKEVVVPMVPISQVNNRAGKYWGYSGSTVVCISDAPIAISRLVPVSLRGRVRGTEVSTVSRGVESAQTNTVVLDNCRVGPPEDMDQLWADAQRGQ